MINLSLLYLKFIILMLYVFPTDKFYELYYITILLPLYLQSTEDTVYYPLQLSLILFCASFFRCDVKKRIRYSPT